MGCGGRHRPALVRLPDLTAGRLGAARRRAERLQLSATRRVAPAGVRGARAFGGRRQRQVARRASVRPEPEPERRVLAPVPRDEALRAHVPAAGAFARVSPAPQCMSTGHGIVRYGTARHTCTSVRVGRRRCCCRRRTGRRGRDGRRLRRAVLRGGRTRPRAGAQLVLRGGHEGAAAARRLGARAARRRAARCSRRGRRPRAVDPTAPQRCWYAIVPLLRQSLSCARAH